MWLIHLEPRLCQILEKPRTGGGGVYMCVGGGGGGGRGGLT